MNFEHVALISIPFLILSLWTCVHYGCLGKKNAAAVTASYLLSSLCTIGLRLAQPGEMPLLAQVLFLFGFVILFMRLFFGVMKIQADKRCFWLATFFAVCASPVVCQILTVLAAMII